MICLYNVRKLTIYFHILVTWGPTPDGYYNQIPRSVRDAIFTSQNWTRTSTECENNGTFNGFQHVVPGDYSTALLFDVNGVIAGIQILVCLYDFPSNFYF